MVRENKAYDERLNQLLDTAQLLFFQKGYEKTSVQNLIDTVKIAKGTFYHYFTSKEDLLEQLLDRQVEHIMAPINEMLAQADLSAIDKLNRMFKIGGMQKIQSKAALQMMARAIYADSNLKLRDKLKQKNFELMQPAYEQIIVQGKQEQVFDTIAAPEAADMICSLHLGLSDMSIPLFIAILDKEAPLASLESKLYAFEFAIARILGVKPDTIQLINREIFELFRSETEHNE